MKRFSSRCAVLLKVLCGVAMMTYALLASSTDDCGTTAIGLNQPVRVGQAVVFKTSGLAVDADGAPNSYLADGKGLSDTCDGALAIVNGKRVTPKSDPHNWYSICQRAWAAAIAWDDFSKIAIFGFLTDSKNHPIVQSSGDPYPGKAYITTTTLTIAGTPAD